MSTAFDAQSLDNQIALANEATRLLLMGEWAEGFDLYRWRLISRHVNAPIPDDDAPEKFRAHLILGKPIVVYGEQGIGDQIFFMRYCRNWNVRPHTYVCLQKKLEHLYSHNGFRCIDWDDEIPGAYSVMIGDLPFLLGIDYPVEPLKLDPWDVYHRMIQRLVYEDSSVKSRTVFVCWRSGQEWQKEIPIPTLAEYLKGTCRNVGNIGNITRFPKFKELADLEALSGLDIADLWEMNEDPLLLCSLFAFGHQYIGVSSAAAHLFGSSRNGGKIKIFPHGGLSWYWKSDPKAWYPNAEIVTWEASK